MQLKKIFSIILVATLLFSVFAINTNAEDFETLKVGVVAESATPIFDTYPIYNHGDEVSFKISVDQNPGSSTVYMWISFDTNAFEYVSHKSAGLFTGKENFSTSFLSNGNFQYKYDFNKLSSTNTGDVFSLTLRVKEGYCGDANITARLRNDDPKNCILYTGVSSSPTQVVPFEGSTYTVTVHDIESVEAKEPTCSEVGWNDHLACKDCEYSNRVEKDKLGHKLENVPAKVPTCTEGGWDKHTECAVCGEKSFHFTYAPTGHIAADAVEEKRIEPTCTEAGSYDSVVYCLECNEELSRQTNSVDPIGHRLENVPAKAPTCSDGGWDKHTECAICGEKSPHFTYEPLPHTAADAVEENRVEPTCTNAGSYDMVIYCEVCNTEISRDTYSVDALGHKLENVPAKEPTCTEGGWDKHTECAVCGEKSFHFTYAPLGHNANDAVRENIIVESCEEDGSYDEVVYCSVCDVELSRNNVIVEKLGHNYECISDVINDPTCTDDGSEIKVYECTLCGASYEDVIVKPALGHNYKAYMYEPTCTTKGYTKYVCELCGDEIIDNYVSEKGHSFGEVVVVKPTYESEGYSYHICTECQAEEKFDFVPVISFVNGDVNGDGVVNNRDLAMLMRYLNDFEDDIIVAAADVNGNGVVNNKDYALLMQYLNGWEVELQ